MAKKRDGRKGRKVLDLNTKILISIRDELRQLTGIVGPHTGILQEHTSILREHTTILHEHGSILREHSVQIADVSKAILELGQETRRWVAHFDRDYLRLATKFDAFRKRLEKWEHKLFLQ